MTEEEIIKEFSKQINKNMVEYMKNYLNVTKQDNSERYFYNIIDYLAKLKLIGSNNVDISTELESINKKLNQLKVLSVFITIKGIAEM